MEKQQTTKHSKTERYNEKTYNFYFNCNNIYQLRLNK